MRLGGVGWIDWRISGAGGETRTFALTCVLN